MRVFLAKVERSKMMRTEGYLTATGVFKKYGVYLVYLMRASNDQKQFYLTCKERI